MEGLTLKDLKARLLKRAYLPRGSRPLLVFPKDTGAHIESESTARAASGVSARLAFFLPPGSYATLVLKVLAATAALPNEKGGE